MEITPPRPLQQGDDLTAFDCGQSSLNKWLQNHAWRNQQTGASRTNVVCDNASGQLVGYVSLSSGSIERGAMKRGLRHGKPEIIPVTLLGQLAVDENFVGQNLGESLLYFALKTAFNMSKHVGTLGVMTHPLNENARQFYLRYGFEEIPGDQRGALLLRIKDIEASGF